VDWSTYSILKPNLHGTKIFTDYPLEELIDYIDMSPFFHAWEMKGVFPSILKSQKYGEEAQKLYLDGKNMLKKIISDKQLTAKAVIGIFPAYAKDETVYTENIEFHFHRQLIDKGLDSLNYSLSDFIAPKDDYIGLFAVTTGHGVKELAAEYEKNNDDYSAIMLKVLADRLVEALAEQLHEKVRKEFWGYAPEEDLGNVDLIKEKYNGIRPAPGFPACPEHSEKDKIWEILNVKENTGITLTETRAMYPAASVCGWYFSHPKSKYFSLRDKWSDASNNKIQNKQKLLENQSK
jgi:5-methyltetrahydrofolate--homocysteine methyltransferase